MEYAVRGGAGPSLYPPHSRGPLILTHRELDSALVGSMSRTAALHTQLGKRFVNYWLQNAPPRLTDLVVAETPALFGNNLFLRSGE